MLLDTIQSGLKVLRNNTKQIKMALLLITPIFLLVRPVKYNNSSEESLIDESALITDPGFCDSPFEYEERPPHETICILYSGSRAFEKELVGKINKLIIRSKSIKVLREDILENVFIKIHVTEGTENKLLLHPLRCSQPNSDLMAIASKIFRSSVVIELADIFPYRFENRIDLELNFDDNSIIKFCLMLRYYSNIHSHYYGGYYYIPLNTGMITFPMLREFILCCLLHELFEVENRISPFLLLFHSMLYYLIPPAGFFVMRKPCRAMYLFIFCVLNFKFGLLCCLYVYVSEVWTLFCGGLLKLKSL